MSGEVFYGRTVRRSEGSRTAKGIVGRRTVGSFYSILVLPQLGCHMGPTLFIKHDAGTWDPKGWEPLLYCVHKVLQIFIAYFYATNIFLYGI